MPGHKTGSLTDAVQPVIQTTFAYNQTELYGWTRTILTSALWLLALLSLGLVTPPPAQAAKCLFISSYHQGYAWSDGVERGVRSILDGKCELKQFNMDTKRHKEVAMIKQKALEAKQLIESWQPDVVITADDNAAKYIIKPFYKDQPTPFVFCGVNWTVKEYGFPYRNVTGMIEVAPIEPLFDKAEAFLPKYERAFYIGADTLTEHKNLKRFQEAAERRGISLAYRLVGTVDAWLKAYREAQNYDFIIMGSNSGINDWDKEKILAGVKTSTRRLSLTNHEWMMPYTILGLTKIPEEHGEWAAQVALHILDGIEPSHIPIIPNRKWDIWINPPLLETTDVKVPQKLLHKGKKVY